jgi:hypothetical protein
VVIIVPPLNASLDDDQEQGSPKTTESTSKYRIQHRLLEQAYKKTALFDENTNQNMNKNYKMCSLLIIIVITVIIDSGLI